VGTKTPSSDSRTLQSNHYIGVCAGGVGGIERLGLIADQFQLHGAFWNAISNLNDNFGTLGYGIVALFVVSWGLSFLIYRFKRYDFNPGLDRF
jgi:high-affinity nickel-transport protein